jgi:hypothetical protein
MEVSEGREALRNAGLAIIAVGVVLAGLVYGRTFLVPLAISILVWNLLEAMIESFARLREAFGCRNGLRRSSGSRWCCLASIS